jgi:exodeoxyribonuclease VII small subunit
MAAKRVEKGGRAEDEPGFEESLERLEAIVEELEGGELPLERAIALFEEGVALGKRCGAKLEEAEKKITILLEQAGGGVREETFEADEAEAPAPTPARKASAPKGRAARKDQPSFLADAAAEDDSDDDDVPF